MDQLKLPLMPNVGPWEGCRIQAKQLFFRWAPIACATPIVVVLFPSPNGVGVILEKKVIIKLIFVLITSSNMPNYSGIDWFLLMINLRADA